MKAVKCIITPQDITINDVMAAIDPPLSLEEFADEIKAIRRRSEESDEQQIRQIGERLFQRVFSEAALDQYRAADQAALALVVMDDLALLPWELLHDGENWVARTRGVMRAAFSDQSPPDIIPKSGALKVLAAIAGPLLYDDGSLPDDEQPGPVDVNAQAEIFHRLEGEQFSAEIKLRKHVTREMLTRDVSENYHILHFVGHGAVGRLVFENRHGIADLAEEDWIREQVTVALRGGLRLVVVNSCHSADASDEMPGVAATILKTGVPAVIAMQGEISEPADLTFVRNLYDALAKGKPIDEAVMDARRAMATDRQIGAWEWATPVLFINESLLEEEASLNLMDAGMAGMMTSPKVSIVEAWKASLDPMMTRDEKFVGRRRELSNVLLSLDPDAGSILAFPDDAGKMPALPGQIVCLHGDGGMGKTAIAIEAAHRMSEWFVDVIWLSGRTAPPKTLREHIKGDDPVTRIRDDEGFLVALANKCGFELTGGEESSQLRDGILKSLGDNQRRLLVLDSMERFTGSDLVRSLLTNLPSNCKALITSRESLEIDERMIHIGPMNSLDSARLLIAYSALKNLRLDSEEMSEIIHITGGHPMAMRLLVSQVVTAEKTLEDALEDLRKAEGDIFDYIFSQSLALAGRDGGKLFAAMAIFMPTGGRKALQAACGLSDADFEKIIKRVVGLSLVESYTQAKRFGLHALARAKAEQLLEADLDGENYRERAAQFFMEFVNATAPMTKPEIAVKAMTEQMPAGMLGQKMIQDAAVEIFVKPAIEKLEADLPNCLLALDWALDKDDLEMAEKFLSALGEFLTARGYWDTATRYLEVMAENWRNKGEHHSEAIASRNLGMMYDRQGRWEDAIQCYENVLKVARESQDRSLEAHTLTGLGTVYGEQRKWDEAGRYFEDSQKIFQALGDERSEAIALNNLGIVHRNTGRWKEAAQSFVNSYKICQRCNEKLGEANALANMGECYRILRQFKDSKEYLNMALKIYDSIGDKEGLGKILNNLGLLHENQADLEQAIQYYQDSLDIRKEIGERVGQQEALHNLSIAHSKQEQWMEAANACLESFQISVQIHSRFVMDSLRNILEVSKNMLRGGELAIPAQLVQQLSLVIQNTVPSDNEMRMALGICPGAFTIIGFMAACEWDRESDIYKEALELARTLDDKTGSGLRLVEWLEGDDASDGS